MTQSTWLLDYPRNFTWTRMDLDMNLCSIAVTFLQPFSIYFGMHWFPQTSQRIKDRILQNKQRVQQLSNICSNAEKELVK